MTKQSDVEKLASLLANQRANRNGGLSIRNVLDILPQHLKDEVFADARAIISAGFVHKDSVKKEKSDVERLAEIIDFKAKISSIQKHRLPSPREFAQTILDAGYVHKDSIELDEDALFDEIEDNIAICIDCNGAGYVGIYKDGRRQPCYYCGGNGDSLGKGYRLNIENIVAAKDQIIKEKSNECSRKTGKDTKR